MKKIILPLSVYLVVCIITVFLPTSDGYNTMGWKLLVGQIYAIPVLFVAIVVSIFVNKKLSHK